MHSDVVLFAEAILKEAAVTGFALWLFAMAVVHVGTRYRISGPRTHGEFIGKCVDIVRVGERRALQFLITNTLRPSPRVANKCPFPHCIAKQYHGGEHEFPRIREGVLVELTPREAKFVAVDEEESA